MHRHAAAASRCHKKESPAWENPESREYDLSGPCGVYSRPGPTGKPVFYGFQAIAAASSEARAATHSLSPVSNSSAFQNGALVFSQSIKNAVACNAASRCGLEAATNTILSPGNSRPTLWITVQPVNSHRLSASAAIRSKAFSVMPG